jgi:hypothetical protein
MNIPKNNVELAEHFAANKEKLRNVDWLTETLRPHCKIKRMGWRGSRLRIIQFPSEFAQWLILLASQNVRSYVEVGTSTGGSFFTVDSYLRAAVPDYRRSIGYDRTSKLRDFDIYHEKFPTCEFRHHSSAQMDLKDEQFDAAFIDARHVERWVLHDFDKVRRNAKIVGFHDIELMGSTVGPAWKKIKGAGRSFEFIDFSAPPEARCGIGAVIL